MPLNAKCKLQTCPLSRTPYHLLRPLPRATRTSSILPRRAHGLLSQRQYVLNHLQHARNNFVPNKRQWRRYPSSEQSPPALEHILKKRQSMVSSEDRGLPNDRPSLTRAVWGHDRFRGPQLTVCTEAMRGNDIIVVAPTGLGKS